MREMESLLQRLVVIFNELLNGNVKGIYLHGSVAMGCFTPKSDIDLLVVVDSQVEREVKKQFTTKILELDKEFPEKGVELSIVRKEKINPFLYPTPFEYHYSNDHKKKYIEDSDYILENDVDYDIAAHITVIKERGRTLFGEEISSMFGEISPLYYQDSIYRDVSDVMEKGRDNSTYYVLNLCRALYYFKEGVVSSKKEGGEWGTQNLPAEYKALINGALDAYNNGRRWELSIGEKEHFHSFCQSILAKIKSEKIKYKNGIKGDNGQM
jgi:predicted nucleotidyltransferase